MQVDIINSPESVRWWILQVHVSKLLNERWYLMWFAFKIIIKQTDGAKLVVGDKYVQEGPRQVRDQCGWLPRWLSRWRIHLWCTRPRFDPWVEKIPWRRAGRLTPVFLPGESPWTEEPGRLQSTGSQRVGHDWATKHSTAQVSVPEKYYYIIKNKDSNCTWREDREEHEAQLGPCRRSLDQSG